MSGASPGLSPEQLAQLRALLEAVTPRSPDWTDGLKAWGEFIGQAGWPFVALVALVLFRGPISFIQMFAYKDVKVLIGRELDRAAKRASGEAPETRKGGPTADEVAQSGEVAKLAENADLQAIRTTAIDLAAEYERTRAAMLPGAERTRRMEVVVSKMRTLGRAVIPLRHEFMMSPTPGQRLLAIASFQVAPDFETLDWLVQRLASEKPFLGYHAAVALVVAARDPRAAVNRAELRSAKAEVEKLEPGLPADSDRNTTLDDFKALVDRLDAA